jgi:hypothetical protein
LGLYPHFNSARLSRLRSFNCRLDLFLSHGSTMPERPLLTITSINFAGQSTGGHCQTSVTVPKKPVKVLVCRANSRALPLSPSRRFNSSPEVIHLAGMTRSLALELGDRNIRVNSVHPGIIATPMVEHTPTRSMARLQAAISRQPIKRMGRPEEIASAALFFASDESSFCTGASLVVDGGHIAGPYRDPM